MTTSPIQGRTPGAMGHAVAAPPAPPLLGTPLEPYRLSPLEIAWGWVGGGLMGPVQDVENSSRGVIGAMEAALLPALVRTPCLIQFSGGRDSSVILAIALRLARKEGLDLPIAVTQRFVGIEEADEDAWQESVVRHLGVRDWERVAWRDELDIVGPIAGPSLEARGLVWPTLAHTHWPLIEQANKGSLVTGEGGDEVLGQRRASVARALVAHPRRNLRQMVPATSAAIAPRMVRTRELRRRYDKSLATPWLRPEPRAALLDVLARDQAAEPFDWRQAIRRHPHSRAVRLGIRTLDQFAAEFDVASFHPFLDPGVLRALGDAGGPFGFADRTRALRSLFAPFLPDAVLARATKARFNRASFSAHSRAFAQAWSGSGIDPDLVDADALAATWAGAEPNAMSFALLQSCWLSSRTR